MTNTLIVTKSDNRKTGKVALATYRTQDSCPTTCSMFGQGCYAENQGMGGSPTPFQHAARGALGSVHAGLIEKIRAIPAGNVIRLNVAGDYLLPDGTPDMDYIEATNEARHLVVLSYTHAWRVMDPAWFHDETRPNASCDSVKDVADALAAGWKAVIVDPDGRYPQGSEVAGQTAVVCPHETTGRQCIDCRLCARQKRSSVVVFNVHGVQRKKAAAALQGAA